MNAAGDEGFNTESTMFVCNRWDMIPNKDKDAVAADTFDKLSKFYANLRKQQVHYMSLTEVIVEPRCEKTGLHGFRPGPTQTGLCSHRIWLEA